MHEAPQNSLLQPIISAGPLAPQAPPPSLSSSAALAPSRQPPAPRIYDAYRTKTTSALLLLGAALGIWMSSQRAATAQSHNERTCLLLETLITPCCKISFGLILLASKDAALISWGLAASAIAYCFEFYTDPYQIKTPLPIFLATLAGYLMMTYDSLPHTPGRIFSIGVAITTTGTAFNCIQHNPQPNAHMRTAVELCNLMMLLIWCFYPPIQLQTERNSQQTERNPQQEEEGRECRTAFLRQSGSITPPHASEQTTNFTNQLVLC